MAGEAPFRSVTEIVERRAAELPDAPAFCTAPQGSDQYTVITYRQFSLAADRLAQQYEQTPLNPEHLQPRVVGVISQTGLPFALLEIALLRLGLTALLLSPNNSVAALAHLLTITGSQHLLYHERYARQAEETRLLFEQQGKPPLCIVQEIPLILDAATDWSTFKPRPRIMSYDDESKRMAVIMHSSGSTGFPKPLPATHAATAALATFHFGLAGMLTTPIYHAHGHNAFFRTIHAAQPQAIFPAHLPFTSSAIKQAITAFERVMAPTHPALLAHTHFYAVPYNLKLLAEDEATVSELARFDTVTFAGSAMPEQLGQKLVEAGVPLVGVYGCSETGAFMTSYRKYDEDKDWNWMRDTGKIANYLRWEERSPGIYEPVVLDGWPAKIKSNTPDNGYAVGDVFIKHPTREHLWKCIGRFDATLVHVNGEKTNPLPIELVLKGTSPYILEAVVFGAGRAQTGCLVVPSDLGRDLKPAEMLAKVWPAVEAANAEAPTHSRLLPEMLVFLPYGTTVPVADKLSILRPAAYAKFKTLIDACYDKFEAESTIKRDLTGADLLAFLRTIVLATLGESAAAHLQDDTDLFALGVDSLQATRIRNLIQRELELGGRRLNQNVVYEHPSLQKLAAYLDALRSGSASTPDASSQHQLMRDLVDKYSSRFRLAPAPSTSSSSSSTETYVLTGATGSLGAHLVNQLLARHRSSTVVCLVRAKDDRDARQRVEASLRARKISLTDGALGRLRCHAASMGQERLGLAPAVYDQLVQDTTAVVHNGWTVNFNLGLASFESENIAGLASLLNLCLASPRTTKPTFAFSSSIGAVQALSSPSIAEAYPDSAASAASTGYAQSKWVGERLCEVAAKIYGVPVRTLRIGQIVGDTEHGVWNESEGQPLLLQTAQSLACLPDLDEASAWLPVDLAAQAAVELLDHPETGVFHLVQRQPTPWAAVLAGLAAAGVSFDVVPIATWLERLAVAPDDVPAKKLLPFFQQRYAPGRRSTEQTFETTKACAGSRTLSKVAAVDEALVKQFVGHWRETGFFAA